MMDEVMYLDEDAHGASDIDPDDFEARVKACAKRQFEDIHQALVLVGDVDEMGNKWGYNAHGHPPIELVSAVSCIVAIRLVTLFDAVEKAKWEMIAAEMMSEMRKEMTS
jgi:hypothetical protein